MARWRYATTPWPPLPVKPQHDANSTVLSTRHPLLNAWRAAKSVAITPHARWWIKRRACMPGAAAGHPLCGAGGVAEQDYLRAWRRMLHAFHCSDECAGAAGRGGWPPALSGKRRDGCALQASKAQLEASEARFRGMVENLPFPLTITALADRSLLVCQCPCLPAVWHDAETTRAGPATRSQPFYVDPVERANCPSAWPVPSKVDNIELQFPARQWHLVLGWCQRCASGV